jgi:hypothetical protein
MAVRKLRGAETPEQRRIRERAAASRRADQPTDPTGEHHAACAELARATGADVGDVIDTWDACATTRAYDTDRATAERLALGDVRDIYHRKGKP